ncbi:MAG: ATP-binding cassette domain-containing protein [bacterium]|nr:ATP-binding cassette domain-containing protein [Candidatus Kapabacteria bacterium]
MIAVRSLHKHFAGIHAVDGVSLDVNGGEIFGLLGPNGAGKSTTIRMITNIIRPDSGDITYDGIPFNDSVRMRIGYLPEERGLYQKARILETVVYMGRLKGLDDRTARTRALGWMERFGIEGAKTRKVEELSKGNQQKLQIIAALIHEPHYIIFDEATSGLDPVNQEMLRTIIEELRASGRTILYSTHQMEQAERICTRIALINRGRVVLSGTVDEVRRERGGNNVVVEFEGDGNFLQALPAVKRGTVYRNRAELELNADASLDDLLPHFAGRLRCSRIERVQPTLNMIFIETVGRANVPQEMLDDSVEVRV